MDVVNRFSTGVLNCYHSVESDVVIPTSDFARMSILVGSLVVLILITILVHMILMTLAFLYLLPRSVVTVLCLTLLWFDGRFYVSS